MNDRGHLDLLTLDRLRLGSLPEADALAARAHLQGCPACGAAFAEVEEDARHFAAAVLPRTLPRLQERLARRSLLARLAAHWRLAVPALAAAAAVALVFVGVRTGEPPGPESDLRIKGGPLLQVWAARGERVFRLEEGARLQAGDRIRFVVERGEAGPYLLIASRDGAGTVSVYFPAQGERSEAVEAGPRELPGAIELDATPGTERLFAFFSERPLEAGEVRRALGRWPAPPALDARLVAFTFEKDAR